MEGICSLWHLSLEQLGLGSSFPSMDSRAGRHGREHSSSPGWEIAYGPMSPCWDPRLAVVDRLCSLQPLVSRRDHQGDKRSGLRGGRNRSDGTGLNCHCCGDMWPVCHPRCVVWVVVTPWGCPLPSGSISGTFICIP